MKQAHVQMSGRCALACAVNPVGIAQRIDFWVMCLVVQPDPERRRNEIEWPDRHLKHTLRAGVLYDDIVAKAVAEKNERGLAVANDQADQQGQPNQTGFAQHHVAAENNAQMAANPYQVATVRLKGLT